MYINVYKYLHIFQWEKMDSIKQNKKKIDCCLAREWGKNVNKLIEIDSFKMVNILPNALKFSQYLLIQH